MLLNNRTGFCKSFVFTKRKSLGHFSSITAATNHVNTRKLCNNIYRLKLLSVSGFTQCYVVQHIPSQSVRLPVHVQAHESYSSGITAGVYGDSDMRSPQNWYEAAERTQRVIQQSMRELEGHLQEFDDQQLSGQGPAWNYQTHVQLLQRSAVDRLLAAVNAADSLLLPSQHCAQHHPDPTWQEAAAQVAQVATDMQQQLQQITQQLDSHPLLSDGPKDLADCTRIPRHSILGMIAGADNPGNAMVNASSGGLDRTAPDQEHLHMLLDLMAELQGVADHILSPISGHSVLLIHMKDAHSSNSDPHHMDMDSDFLRRLPSVQQYVIDRQTLFDSTGYHQNDRDPINTTEPQQLWATDVHLNQLMSGQAKSSEAQVVSNARQSMPSRSLPGSDHHHHVDGLVPYIPKPSSRVDNNCRFGGNVIELPADLGTIDFGPSVWMTHTAEKALQKDRPVSLDDVRVLELSLPTCLALLAGHPSSKLRCYLYGAGLRPRLRAFFSVVDGLRQVRQALAEVQGSESWAHLHLHSYSAGCPEAAVAVLEDIVRAWKSPALEQQQAFTDILSQVDSIAAHHGSEGKAVAPWDVDYCMHGMLGASRPLQWQRFMSRFPVLHVVSTGLSRVLEPAAINFKLLSFNAEHELWNTHVHTNAWGVGSAGEQSQHVFSPIKLLISDVATTAQRVGGGTDDMPVGIVYVIPDPNAALPFTCVVRPAGPSCPTSSQDAHHQATHTHVIHVAVHIPATQLVPLAHQSYNDSTIQDSQRYGVTEPSMLRLLLHEMGHAVSYVLTGHGRPTCRSCVSFASVEVAELSSHVLERVTCDPGSLMLLSYSTSPSQQLSRAESRGLATLMAAPLTSYSPTELQQHALLALTDVLLHAPGCNAMSTEEVLESVWRSHGALKDPAFTQRLMSLLPGLIHLSGGILSAYPTSELVAAALWHHLDLEYKVVGASASRQSGWRLVRDKVLSATADVSLKDVMVPVFGVDSMIRHPAQQGSMAVLNLASPVFQDMSL